jgi:hypothetical protein
MVISLLSSGKIFSVGRIFAGEELFEFSFEFVDVFEVAVNAGEADIGDGVEILEVFHEELADFGGGSLSFGGVHEEGFGFIDEVFEFCGGDGSFFAGAEESVEDFAAFEFFAAAIFFDDHVGDFVDALVGGEAFVASLTLAASADGVSFFAFARVNDAVLGEPAIRALHVDMDDFRAFAGMYAEE